MRSRRLGCAMFATLLTTLLMAVSLPIVVSPDALLPAALLGIWVVFMAAFWLITARDRQERPSISIREAWAEARAWYRRTRVQRIIAGLTLSFAMIAVAYLTGEVGLVAALAIYMIAALAYIVWQRRRAGARPAPAEGGAHAPRAYDDQVVSIGVGIAQPASTSGRVAAEQKSGTWAYGGSLGFAIVADFGDQSSDPQGGFADKTFRVPNPNYCLA